jgi:hypothetical protein
MMAEDKVREIVTQAIQIRRGVSLVVQQAPKVLAPAIKELILNPVNSERITQALTVNMVCTEADAYDLGCSGRRMAGQRTVNLVDGSYQSLPMILKGGGSSDQKYTFNGPVDAAISPSGDRLPR